MSVGTSAVLQNVHFFIETCCILYLKAALSEWPMLASQKPESENRVNLWYAPRKVHIPLHLCFNGFWILFCSSLAVKYN